HHLEFVLGGRRALEHPAIKYKGLAEGEAFVSNLSARKGAFLLGWPVPHNHLRQRPPERRIGQAVSQCRQAVESNCRHLGAFGRLLGLLWP
ncbi:hypothetical protein RSP799_02615, partial [Ralstonia solanacearum]